MRAAWLLAAAAWILSPILPGKDLDWSLLLWLTAGVVLSLLALFLFPSLWPQDRSWSFWVRPRFCEGNPDCPTCRPANHTPAPSGLSVASSGYVPTRYVWPDANPAMDPTGALTTTPSHGRIPPTEEPISSHTSTRPSSPPTGGDGRRTD
jgi:hypothetical protein